MKHILIDYSEETITMDRTDRRPVDPHRLIARGRRWSRASVTAAGAATVALTGWIAFSTGSSATAATPTHQDVNAPQTQHTSDDSSDDDAPSNNAGTASVPSISTTVQQPTITNVPSNSSGNSTPQATTRAS